jgi:hypothetical protein
MLYKDIITIIEDYIDLLQIHDRKVKVLSQINNINRYEISLCKICRTVKVKNEFLRINNNYEDHTHNFYLTKPIFLLNNNNKEIRLLKHIMFNFYCRDCNEYSLFYNHLNHN